MALKGTLKDFGIADIFQLIGQQQKTGVLHLIDHDQEVHVAFKDGNVVRAESSTRRRKELRGDMLIRAGLITERQLEEALEEQKRTLKRLGDILVGAGYIGRVSLREMAHLQTTETLYRLFTWKTGDYEFEAAEVDYDPETVTPIRSESVLMEGFRRIDEWPVIRKRIPNNAVTFEKLRELGDRPAAAQDDVDAAFDEAFGGFEEGGDAPKKKEEGGEFSSVGENERIVFRLVEPGRDVQAIVDRSRLGEFEACKALLNLVNAGYLKPIAARTRSAGSEGAPRSRWAERLVGLSGWLATAVLLLGLAGLVVARLVPSEGRDVAPGDPALRRHLSHAQLGRLEAALATYALQHGRSPEALSELVDAGILAEADLRYPWGEPYHYRRTGPSSFILLPPLR